MLYNVRATDELPNLETFLANSGTIHLVAYDPARKLGDAYISEVMWGTDASQEPVNNSNWIEIRNGTSKAIGIDETYGHCGSMKRTRLRLPSIGRIVPTRDR